MANMRYYNRNELATAFVVGNRFVRHNDPTERHVSVNGNTFVACDTRRKWEYRATLAQSGNGVRTRAYEMPVAFNPTQSIRALKHIDADTVAVSPEGTFSAYGVTAATTDHTSSNREVRKYVHEWDPDNVELIGHITPKVWAQMRRAATGVMKACGSWAAIYETNVVHDTLGDIVGVSPFALTAEPADLMLRAPFSVPAPLVLTIGAMRRAGWEGWTVFRSGVTVKLLSTHEGVTETVWYQERNSVSTARIDAARNAKYQRVGTVDCAALRAMLATCKFSPVSAGSGPSCGRVWFVDRGTRRLHVDSVGAVGDGGAFQLPLSGRAGSGRVEAVLANHIAAAAAGFIGQGEVTILFCADAPTPKVKFVGDDGSEFIVPQVRVGG